jgi:hypothetical protein
MSDYSVETIREVLEREVPQIRTGDGIGVLFGLFVSVLILSGLGLGLTLMAVPNAGPLAMLAGPLLVLVISYFIGAALEGSTSMVGADMAEASASDYNDSWSGYGRDHATTGIQLGLLLMVGQMLAGAVYGTVKYLRERGSVTDKNTSRIAAAFLCQILNSGPQKQEKLFAMPALQSCSMEEKREALTALVSSGFVDSLPTGVQISPDKRYHF